MSSSITEGLLSVDAAYGSLMKCLGMRLSLIHEVYKGASEVQANYDELDAYAAEFSSLCAQIKALLAKPGSTATVTFA